MQSFLADFFDRSGSRIRTEVLVDNAENFAQKFGGLPPQLLSEIFCVIYQYYCTNSSSATGNTVALADHDEVSFAVIESHFSFVPHSELQESRNQWEFQSGTNEK
eukprot:COSAG03_NODE_508_length_7337_cov_6.411854_5_plen_105_part_00